MYTILSANNVVELQKQVSKFLEKNESYTPVGGPVVFQDEIHQALVEEFDEDEEY